MSYVKVIGNLKTIASNWFIQLGDIVTSIRDSNSASDSKVPSEKAVRTAISEAVTGAISGDLYTADETTITLSEDRKFSVKNGGVGTDQLSADVNTSLEKANSALQEHQSLASYYTSSQTDTAIANHHDSTKQDVINDLDTIRSGAQAGATALQSSAISDMLTKTEASNTYQVAGSYAPLVDSKVPAANLPSYVDDVLEGYLSNGSFYTDSTHTTLITAEPGKIYVDLASNKTYRYSGSQFTEISASLAIGDTVGTAYDGAAGAQNAANIATNTANIATNTADIATNTANIATNTTDITALQNGKISTTALSSYIDIKIVGENPTADETAAGYEEGDIYLVFSNEGSSSA